MDWDPWPRRESVGGPLPQGVWASRPRGGTRGLSGLLRPPPVKTLGAVSGRRARQRGPHCGIPAAAEHGVARAAWEKDSACARRCSRPRPQTATARDRGAPAAPALSARAQISQNPWRPSGPRAGLRASLWPAARLRVRPDPSSACGLQGIEPALARGLSGWRLCRRTRGGWELGGLGAGVRPGAQSGNPAVWETAVWAFESRRAVSPRPPVPTLLSARLAHTQEDEGSEKGLSRGVLLMCRSTAPHSPAVRQRYGRGSEGLAQDPARLARSLLLVLTLRGRDGGAGGRLSCPEHFPGPPLCFLVAGGVTNPKSLWGRWRARVGTWGLAQLP